MKSYFVTGTDTEVGKTFVMCGLLVALRRHGIDAAPMKPISAGLIEQDGVALNEDVHQLLAAYSRPIDHKLVNPFAFQHPIAPHLAAAAEGRAISLDAIDDAFKQLADAHPCVLVEGAGGFLVPLSAEESMAVLPQRLGLDVILVVGMRLGCLNHALLTVEAIRARGLVLAGWVANRIDPDMRAADENIAALKSMLDAPLLGVVPRITEADGLRAAQAVAAYLQVEPLLG